jgi:flagellar biosynthesis GTPase FlhF
MYDDRHAICCRHGTDFVSGDVAAYILGLRAGADPSLDVVTRAIRALGILVHPDHARYLSLETQGRAALVFAVSRRAADILLELTPLQTVDDMPSRVEGGPTAVQRQAERRKADKQARAEQRAQDRAARADTAREAASRRTSNRAERAQANAQAREEAARAAAEERAERDRQRAERREEQRRRRQEQADEGERRKRPALPETRVPDPAGDKWSQIDAISALDCAFTGPGVRMMPFVPLEHMETWAEAMRDVLHQREEAATDAERDRALKWQLALPQLLLRSSTRRAGRDGQAKRAAAVRFHHWQQGDFRELVASWRRDVDEAREGWLQHHGGRQSESRAQLRAVTLIEEGEISKGINLLLSHGLGDLADARILAQLEAKQPARKEELDPAVFAFEPSSPPLQLEALGAVMEALRRFVGFGPSGMRNEYLLALVGPLAPRAGDDAVTRLTALANDYVSDRLPPWYSSTFLFLRLFQTGRGSSF